MFTSMLLALGMIVSSHTARVSPQFLPPPDSPIHPCYSGVGCALYGEGVCRNGGYDSGGVEWGEDSKKTVCRVHCSPKDGSALELQGINDVTYDFVCKRPWPSQGA